MDKGSLYYIYFELSGKSFPHVTTKEYNTILNAFNVVSSIYDKCKPNGRKSFLDYSFILKKLLIMLEKEMHTTIEDPLKAEGTRACVGTND